MLTEENNSLLKHLDYLKVLIIILFKILLILLGI